MLLTPTVILLTFIVILVSALGYKRYQSLYLLKRRGFPGPKPTFFLGNVPDLFSNKVAVINKWIKEYGKVFAIYEFGPTVYVADPGLARQILVKEFTHFHHRRTFIQEGGADANPEYEVSVISDDIPFQRWREQRALIASAFTSSKIKSSVTIMNEGIDDLMENIDAALSEQDFDIYDLLQRLTMDTIGRSAFGTKLNVQKHPDNEFFEATKRVFDDPGTSWKMILLFVSLVFPELFYILYPIRKLQRIILNGIGCPSHFSFQLQMCIDITKKRRDQRIAGEQTPDDLLQQLIDASLTADEMSNVSEANTHAGGQQENKKSGKVYRMNDAEIAANASIMFDAGFETTSTLLGFMAHVLVNRPEIQDEIRKEVLQLLHDEGQLDYNTFHSLPYLDSFVYETLRYYPPITGFVTRQSTVEYKYKNITIPADVSVTIAVPALQHDPEIWEDPETFDPLRFYGENKSRVQSPGFQAFGSGPRNCVGMRFALVEAKLTIARIVSKYKLVPGPRTQSFDELAIQYKFVNQNPTQVFVRAVKIN